MLGAVATALVVSADAAAENLLPLGPPTMGGRNAGCQVITSAEAQAALGRKTVIGQYDAGNLFICNLGLGYRMVQIGVFDTWYGDRWWRQQTTLRSNRATGTTVSALGGLGRAALKYEVRRDGEVTVREVMVRVGARAFRVTVLTDSATFPQLIRIARVVARRLA